MKRPGEAVLPEPVSKSQKQDLDQLRNQTLVEKLKHQDSLDVQHREISAELFFLEEKGNLFDYSTWRDQPSAQLLAIWEKAGIPPEVVQPLSSPVEVVIDEDEGQVEEPISIKCPPTDDPDASEAPADSQLSVCSNADSEQNVPVENIVEKAKQEAWVISRIAELKKEGMWTAKRLPKCVDPPRVKTQWDYVLDEMQWLATDFEQERRWKRMAAKKLALAIVRQNKEVNDKLRKAELDKEKDLRKIASFIGKEIMLFWKNARKVIEYRTRNLVEAKKKKALDTHLDLIVDRSEKYSALLQENLQRSSRSPSLNSDQSKEDHDADFNAGGINSDASDDETTIAQAEKQLGSADNDINEELRDLEKVGDMEVDDLLDSLPPEYLELLRLEAEKTDKKESVEPGEDRPTTSASTGSVVSSKESNQESLQRLEKLDAEPTADTSERESELSNIAQAAEKFQPTGFTLETTKVVTTVPFLIKHTLREYQHVGLDWLVALNKRNLNGILADEMGLGKTIQTIALLAYLACEDTNWGPHLVVVPTSVMLNWEMEFKKWCPSFKILTYYGTQKERAEKRKGWTKPNAFHVCITSYKIVLTDQRSFRNRRWRYFILDEAQNIKNFKSQRWQLLLNFNSEHRLLLTGTPLQNNLLELWSLMHFLMPGIFTSHRDFKDWFANPLTGMVEGSKEYNDGIVKRLHKVLRPFLLRRLKVDVEKQMPKKYEHVLKCHLSKRQRYLYDDFMSRKSVKDSLTGGNMMSIINILMQLRKVCNHPNLFEPRPIISPFSVPDPITLNVPSAVCYISVADPTQTVTLPCLSELENSSPSKKMSCRKLGCVSVEDIIELNERTLEEPLPKDSEFSLEPKKKLAKLDMNSRRVSAYGSASSSNGHKVREDDVVVDVDVESDSNKPQFVIPCQLAQHLPFDKPFLIRINTNRGWQLLPIMSKSPLTQAGAGGPLNSTSTLVPNGHIAVLHLVPSLLPNQPPTAELLETVPVNDPSTPDRLQALMNDSLAGADAEQGHSSVSHGSLISAVTQTYPKLDAVKVEAHDDIKPVCSRSTSENKNGDLKSAAADQFKTPSVERKRKADKLSIVDTMLRESRRRDLIDAIYGQDLQDLLRFIDYDVKNDEDGRLDQSTVNVLIDRFVLYIPGARSQRPTLRLFSPDQSLLEKERSNTKILYAFLSEKLDKLHKVATGQTAQFPELRLIEYDCGKLQMMSKLLKELYPDGHRVLIFTQMSKMLDILEAFLCSHGYKYLRLDGTTKVEQRHLMMERFNHDSRIFCFILSTRAGGIGVNLTGADTVIFYDSDWNPTMDAQAQDRCHRIGQTRDVHIYRLICEKTVEENILKKAQQKKLLSDMAIEGGAFTVDFFKPNSIRDLFDLTDPGSSNSVTTTANAISDSGNLNTLPNIESELAKFEDEQDVIAAKEVEREVEDDLAEFDENKPIEDECDRVMKEMNNLVEQLSGIEKYAVKFLEVEMQDLIDQELEYTEATIAEQQRGWELSHSQAMENMYDNVGDNQQMEPDDVDLDLTYPEEDAVSQVGEQDESALSAFWNKNLVIRTRKARARENPVLKPLIVELDSSGSSSPTHNASPSPKLVPKLVIPSSRFRNSQKRQLETVIIPGGFLEQEASESSDSDIEITSEHNFLSRTRSPPLRNFFDSFRQD